MSYACTQRSLARSGEAAKAMGWFRHRGQGPGFDGYTVTCEYRHSIQSHGDEPGKIQAGFPTRGQMGWQASGSHRKPTKADGLHFLSRWAFGWWNTPARAPTQTGCVDIMFPSQPDCEVGRTSFVLSLPGKTHEPGRGQRLVQQSSASRERTWDSWAPEPL